MERLLVSKSLLGKIRFQPAAEPDHVSLASQLLAAHDAAELALAAISDQLNKLPPKDKHYLMDYFEPLKELHPGREVFAKEYFSSHSVDFIPCFRIHRKWNSCSNWERSNERFPTATTETSAGPGFLSQTPHRSVGA